MPRQLKASVCFLFMEVRRTTMIFWTVLLSLLFVSVMLNWLFFEEGIIMFELAFPIYIFAAIIGQLIVKNSVPYLIKMGSTRSNVFKSVGIYFFIFSLFNAVLANTIHSIMMFLFGNSNVGEPFMTISGNSGQAITFNHLADFFQNVWWTRVLIDTSIAYFLFVCGFILGLIFYRYGVIGGVSFIALMVLTLFIGLSKGWLIPVFVNLFTNISLVFFVQLLLVGLIVYLFSFFLLRRLSIIQ